MFEMTGETTLPGGGPPRGLRDLGRRRPNRRPLHPSRRQTSSSQQGRPVKATSTGPRREAAFRPEEDAAILVASFVERITGWSGDFPEGIFDHEGVA